MKTFTELFKQDFYQKMLTPNIGNPIRNRADSFLKIFEILELKNKKYFSIIETGCMRSDHGNLCFGDDGCSTYIFDKFVNFYDGKVLSVDISLENCDHARNLVSEKTQVINNDSVDFLWNLNINEDIDLLYLDSFDVSKENPHPSQLHHIKELCAIISKLQKGCIIVIDDHNAYFDNRSGKSQYVKDFMENIKAELIFEDYQIGWIL
jgi:hypothetical protein